MRTWIAAAGFLAALAGSASGHTVNVDSLNVRSGPGTTYSIVGTLTRGTVVNTVTTSGTWTQINSPKSGWVASQYLTNTPHTTTTSSDFIWPMTGQLIGVWDSQRASGPHHAIDIGDRIGIPIYAARGGTLSQRNNPTGYGYYVSVTHEAGYRTVYAHLSAYVAPSGSVAKGQYIAKCGDSGNAKGTQPHVHWEIWRYSTKVYMPGTVWSRVTAKTAYPYNYSGI